MMIYRSVTFSYVEYKPSRKLLQFIKNNVPNAKTTSMDNIRQSIEIREYNREWYGVLSEDFSVFFNIKDSRIALLKRSSSKLTVKNF